MIDPKTIKRCGAKTRAGHPCGQFAMKNGRCRLHGGLSTGPKTAEGKARISAARRKHGRQTREVERLKNRIRRFLDAVEDGRIIVP